MSLLGFDALGRLALGQFESTAKQANLTQAAGIGVAGSLSGKVDEGLIGVAGVGVAGAININALMIGVSGTGVAGSLSISESVGPTGAAGTGAVGVGVAGQIGASPPGVQGIGVAGSMFAALSTGLVGVSGTGIARGISASVFGFFAQAVGIGAAGSLSGPNVVPNAPFFGGYDGIVSGRYALGQITGARTDGGVSITVTLAPAIGTGQVGAITATPSTGLVGVAGGGVAGLLTFPSVGGQPVQAAGIGVAGQITIVISGGGSSAGAAAGDRDRRRYKRKTGFEPVIKKWPPEPIGAEESKPLPLPPFSAPPLAPADERSPLDLVDPDLLPPDLLGLQDQIFTAQDISDIERFLRGIEQDEQDAADIADVLALLD
jgi:hypothetical protein